ncbi:MAG: 3-oxoadipate enol-lactonase [Rhodobacteraceae bacterium]|nr:3-oxoadipate enol-lactonase [Paracoccaceae bacterium]
MPMLDRTGMQIHWREDGDPSGTPVVFANSLGTDLTLWDAVLPLLPDRLRLIRFDLRGHGRSGVPPAPYTLDDLVGDAEALLDHLGVRGAVFVGLSLGGLIAQGLAARRPDQVAALVLSNTAAKMGSAEMWRDRIAKIEAGGIASIADPILDRWFGPAFRASAAVAPWRAMLVGTPQEGYVGCCQALAGADLTRSTAGLRLPALAIGGSADGASPSEIVRATAALIPGAKFVEIEDAGHLPCVEAPDAHAAILRQFIEEVTDA